MLILSLSMRRLARVLAVGALVCIAVAMPPRVQAQKASQNLLYMVDAEDSFESFRTHLDQISIVAPQAYAVGADGVVRGQVDPRVLRLAREHDIAVMPLIVNPGFDLESFHDLLTDEEARARTIETLVQLAREHDFYGWQFDFENIHISDRDLLTQFYREAAQALHAEDRTLSIAVVPRTSDFAGETSYHSWIHAYWRAGYDLAALAEIGDFISLMTYSQHTRRTPPGPVAGMPWVEEALAFTLQQGVPPEKISLGIPFYSHYWYPVYSEEEGGRAWGTGLGYAEAMSYVDRYEAELMWSDEQKAHFAFWENDGIFEYVFLEDARSFDAKLDLLDEHDLRGISVWRLGQEDPAMWDVLERRVQTLRP